MSYYNICPFCDANLDPGEICDCIKGHETEPEVIMEPDNPVLAADP